MAVRLAWRSLAMGVWVRQLLTEALLLAGGRAGIPRYVLGKGIRAGASCGSSARPAMCLELDLALELAWLLFFTASIGGSGLGLLFGLVPAFRSSRAQPSDALKSGSRGATAGLLEPLFPSSESWLFSQIAVFVGVASWEALLFVRSFRNLTTFDPGFREKGHSAGFHKPGTHATCRMPSNTQP